MIHITLLRFYYSLESKMSYSEKDACKHEKEKKIISPIQQRCKAKYKKKRKWDYLFFSHISTQPIHPSIPLKVLQPKNHKKAYKYHAPMQNIDRRGVLVNKTKRIGWDFPAIVCIFSPPPLGWLCIIIHHQQQSVHPTRLQSSAAARKPHFSSSSSSASSSSSPFVLHTHSRAAASPASAPATPPLCRWVLRNFVVLQLRPCLAAWWVGVSICSWGGLGILGG